MAKEERKEGTLTKEQVDEMMNKFGSASSTFLKDRLEGRCCSVCGRDYAMTRTMLWKLCDCKDADMTRKN